jgi:malate dehydrogenase
LIYSFPVHIDKNRNWKIVQGLPVSDWARGLMDATAKELIEERNDALETTK